LFLGCFQFTLQIQREISIVCIVNTKHWQNYPNNAWESETPDDHTFIVAWRDFLHSPFAKQHVPEWENKLQSVLDNIELTNETPEEDLPTQEEWMLISDFHNSNKTFGSQNLGEIYNWQPHSLIYIKQQIGEMPNWIKVQKENFIVPDSDYKLIVSVLNKNLPMTYPF
jgi:hypothetical protein